MLHVNLGQHQYTFIKNLFPLFIEGKLFSYFPLRVIKGEKVIHLLVHFLFNVIIILK